MPDPGRLEHRTTQLLRRLIRFNTVNPPGNEQACQEYLKGLLERAGFEVELLSSVEGRPNLVASLKGSSEGPVLCLLGHVDTVLADPAEWAPFDPWSGMAWDGCVWGRGALDMKSQVAAEVAAALTLAEEGWRPASGELKLVLTADEEAGAEHGAKWLCEQHPDKVRADIVVNEGAGEVFEYDGRRLYGVCVAEKGVFRFTLSTGGRAGHASIPRIGDNALVKMAPVLAALAGGRVRPERSPEPDAFLEALGVDSTDLEAAFAQVEAENPAIAVLLEPMLGVTMAPTMIEASEK
ncbi:MAG: M20/M25/M40 family metallo-hydrolase, partial [Thermoleophilaceae bacterium]|nr:M20/M25/M40 family metallo-hydrolase [Thermoleophilaceae bacterium]